MDSNLFLAVFAFFFGVITPGPSNIAISYLALERGRVIALSFALGVIVGSFTWAVSMALSIEYVSEQYAYILDYLKILSAAYFLYFAYHLHTSTANSTKVQISMSSKPYRIFLFGYLFHLLNPKAFVVWSSVFTLGVSGESSVLYVLIICFMLAIGVFCGYALFFSRVRSRVQYGKNQRIINFGIALFFIMIACYLLYSL